MLFEIFNMILHNPFFMGSYSNEVFPEPLSNEEEMNCILKMKDGDMNARNKLIEHNLRLVAHIVKKFESNGQDVDDLIGIGTVGLIKGIDTYSLDKKVKLTTYAAKCAENATFTSKNFLTELMTYLKELVHNYNFLIR